MKQRIQSHVRQPPEAFSSEDESRSGPGDEEEDLELLSEMFETIKSSNSKEALSVNFLELEEGGDD